MLQVIIKEKDKAERLWKWLKKDCLNCKYYSKFCEFKEAIDLSLNKIITGQVQKDLDSLLTNKIF